MGGTRGAAKARDVERRLRLVVVLIVWASVDEIEREARNGSPIVQLAVMLFFHAHRAGWRERMKSGRRRG